MCGVMKDSIIGPLWWEKGDGELKATRSRLSDNFSNDAQLWQDGTSPYFGCIVIL